MEHLYTTEDTRTMMCPDPTHPKLAAAAHLNGPWPYIVASICAGLSAAHEYLTEHGHPKRGVKADDLSLEIIDRASDLDQVDRYLLRLIFGQLCRGTDSKARQATTTATAPPNDPFAHTAPPNGPFAHSVRYGDGHNNQ